MKPQLWSILAALIIFAIGTKAAAHSTYIGYSGAPGSSGRCASSCHGAAGGTIQVTGFPTQYSPGQSYTIAVAHSGGNMIKQLNGSCRIGSGSVNAGTITAGANTVTYDTAGETNGVHMTGLDLHSGTFTWTAPSAGTGPVTLYVAGHQGTASGTNTTVTFTATEQVTDVPVGSLPGTEYALSNFPNPFQTQTAIAFALPQAALVRIEVYDPSGKMLSSFAGQESAGSHQFQWNGSAYPSGIYFVRLRSAAFSETRMMVLAK